MATLADSIRIKEALIANLESNRKNYLLWKQKINQLFFKKYSRFI
jgi:hypothetical protein